MQCIIHKSVILALNSPQCVSHFQPLNSSQLSCSQMSPLVLICDQHLFHAVQLICEYAEPMHLHSQQGVTKTLDHAVHVVLALSVHLEHLQLLGHVHQLAIEGINGGGIHSLLYTLSVSSCSPMTRGLGPMMVCTYWACLTSLSWGPWIR